MRKFVIVTAVLAVIGAVFLAGVAVGSSGAVGFHPAVMTGDGYAGDKVATLWVGDTAYGVTSSVPWRDATGAEHIDGWPDCLATGDLKGIPFTGAVVWSGSVGQATVLWVDCSAR